MTGISDALEDNPIVVCNEPPLKSRVRAYLEQIAPQGVPITYAELAQALQLSPPNTIRQVALALETLMEEDAAAGRPLIAALVISKARGGLPAPGFFDCAAQLGCFNRDAAGLEASEFHAGEFKAAVTFWGEDGES